MKPETLSIHGGFAGDPTMEFDVEGLAGDGPVTDMLFDKSGRIYLAQHELGALADDGELLVKGPYIMEGYLDPPEGVESFDADGWFHTGDLGNTLDGPHGMHPVGSAGVDFADGGHKDMSRNNPDACRACHGMNGEGSVLSRVATDRDFTGMKDGGPVAKGTQVTCTMCHKNEL